MKNWIQVIILLAVLLAAGSIGYYYIYFLPQQSVQSQQDIDAIRKKIAPTNEELRVRDQQAEAQRKIDETTRQKALAACKVKEAAFYDCLNHLQERADAYRKEKCGSVNNFKCTLDLQSEITKKFDCGTPVFCF